MKKGIDIYNYERMFEATVRTMRASKITELYRKIVHFRNNPPDYEVHNFDLDKKIYKKGNINELTQYLDDATTIVKVNYKKIFDILLMFETKILAFFNESSAGSLFA